MTKYLADLGDINVAVKGTDYLAEVLKKYNGEDAVISISHKLYGDQKIQCKFDCIVDEMRIGFRVKGGQEIYMYRDEVQSFLYDKDLYFSDDVMDIKVQIK